MWFSIVCSYLINMSNQKTDQLYFWFSLANGAFVISM